MDIREIFMVIYDYNTEQANYLMDEADIMKHLDGFTLEWSDQIDTIARAKTELLENASREGKEQSDWVDVTFPNYSSIHIRSCENEQELKSLLSGEYNDHKDWYFDKDKTSDNCFDFVVKQAAKTPVARPIIAGYKIQDCNEFRDQYGGVSHIVLGHNEKAPAPWVTWRYIEEYDNYEHGHYFANELSARKDFFERSIELAGIDLKEEYQKDGILSDIRTVLEYNYGNEIVDKLMMNTRFTEEAIETWYALDRSALNEALEEELEKIIDFMRNDLEQNYLNEVQPPFVYEENHCNKVAAEEQLNKEEFKLSK